MRNNNRDSRAMSVAVFQQRFIDHIIDPLPANQIVYGKRVKHYAAGVATAYWEASQEDGRSPEQAAQDDMEFWLTDHATETQA